MKDKDLQLVVLASLAEVHSAGTATRPPNATTGLLVHYLCNVGVSADSDAVYAAASALVEGGHAENVPGPGHFQITDEGSAYILTRRRSRKVRRLLKRARRGPGLLNRILGRLRKDSPLIAAIAGSVAAAAAVALLVRSCGIGSNP